jgi:hypothetical protein
MHDTKAKSASWMPKWPRLHTRDEGPACMDAEMATQIRRDTSASNLTDVLLVAVAGHNVASGGHPIAYRRMVPLVLRLNINQNTILPSH